MARARNIKPGFFKNEDLAECSPWARLLFAGLWTLADRAGRLEDRPKRIKGELFPFDSIEVEPLLQELERFKFIQRYEVDGFKAIQVSNFEAHQTPHYSEKPSVIKPPQFQESGSDEGGGAPGGLQEDSKKSPAIKRGAHPPDSLIPDSLIPDSRKTEDSERATRAPAPEPDTSGHQPTAQGLIGRAMKQAGLAGINTADPRLLELVRQGATVEEFAGIAAEAMAKSPPKGFAWVLATLQARRTEAAAITLAKREPAAQPWAGAM